MTTDLAAKIRAALLESLYVGKVLQVTAGTAEDGKPVAGMRVTVANVPSLDALGPVLADIRSSVRQVLGEETCVYVEIAPSDVVNEDVSTEKIVIRSAD